jgi:hypothetical protein
MSLSAIAIRDRIHHKQEEHFASLNLVFRHMNHASRGEFASRGHLPKGNTLNATA